MNDTHTNAIENRAGRTGTAGESAVDRLYREAERHEDYWAAHAALDFTEQVCREMERLGVTRAELARRMETSPAYVSKILRGESNFTMASMVKLTRALGVPLRIELGEETTSRSGGPAPADPRRTPGASGRSPLGPPTGDRLVGRGGPG